ncbi:MAG: 2-oxoacid:acceptor oxidoreductase family protein [Clostridia bacterium]|nr:2-oxoacid:acceptor oxidoreductase family protein [Clostridia bacterium]
MIQVLWHGRGGQGAFTAARLLGAAYAQKKNGFALSFPSFGPERRGAPIRAFTKLDDRPIGNRSEILQADYSIYLDDTLFSQAALSEIKTGGKILLNTKHPVFDNKVITIDGDTIAKEILGLPITNTIMLGALSAVFNEIEIEEIAQAIRENMPKKLWDKNIAAVKAAREAVR